ncbi:Putative membrane protein OS=Streptomyces griseus subsp. griseus (strain JCM 4626 / NBRC) OX=455632 GN=SGR_6322 PE=4 SV=1 [Streptomyces griseus subsp. griseus]
MAFARAEVPPYPGDSSTSPSLGKPADIGLDPTASTVGGNLVVVASDRPLDAPAIQKALDARDVGWRITTGDDLADWTGDARILTDDHAPVDQLLQPDRTRTAR